MTFDEVSLYPVQNKNLVESEMDVCAVVLPFVWFELFFQFEKLEFVTYFIFKKTFIQTFKHFMRQNVSGLNVPFPIIDLTKRK